MDQKQHCDVPSPHPTIQEFRDYLHHGLKDHLHNGLDGHNRKPEFVCRRALASFWSLSKIREVIEHDNSMECGQLSTSYLQIFSILCYIGSPSLITQFMERTVTDEDLPLRSKHLNSKIWSRTLEGNQNRKLFLRWQWKFCPLMFGGKVSVEKRLSKSQIFPISDLLRLHDDGGPGNMGTALYRVKLYDCCKPEQARSNEVVFKVFDSGRKDLWENETRVYAKILYGASPDLSQAVTRFHGSFVLPGSAACGPFGTKDLRQYRLRDGNTLHGSHNMDSGILSQDQHVPKVWNRARTTRQIIALEYAHGGSLSRFCADNIRLLSSPRWKDRLWLWYQMFNILLGVQAAHQVDVAHRDLNKTNILYSRSPLRDITVPCFKIADFGISKASSQSDETLEDSYLFNYVYMAPECVGSPDYADTLPPPERYASSADVWALGCLFSEMLIRASPLGEEGVQAYRECRIAENEQTGLRDLNWASGFHNGTTRLHCVDEWHHLALQAARESDRAFLQVVSRITLDHMLQPRIVRERMSASQIRSLWLDELLKLENGRRSNEISAMQLGTSIIGKRPCSRNSDLAARTWVTFPGMAGWPRHTPELEVPVAGPIHVDLHFTTSGWLRGAQWHNMLSNIVSTTTSGTHRQSSVHTAANRHPNPRTKSRSERGVSTTNSECAIPEIISRIMVISEGSFL